MLRLLFDGDDTAFREDWNARRAIALLLAGKAEPVEASPRVIRSPSRAFPLPAVIRLAMYIRKPFLDRVAFNKKNILRRDG